MGWTKVLGSGSTAKKFSDRGWSEELAEREVGMKGLALVDEEDRLLVVQDEAGEGLPRGREVKLWIFVRDDDGWDDYMDDIVSLDEALSF